MEDEPPIEVTVTVGEWMSTLELADMLEREQRQDEQPEDAVDHDDDEHHVAEYPDAPLSGTRAGPHGDPQSLAPR